MVGKRLSRYKVDNPQETTMRLQMALTQLGVKVMVWQEVDGWRLEVSELKTTNPIVLADLLGRCEIPRLSDKLFLRIIQRKPL